MESAHDRRERERGRGCRTQPRDQRGGRGLLRLLHAQTPAQRMAASPAPANPERRPLTTCDRGDRYRTYHPPQALAPTFVARHGNLAEGRASQGCEATHEPGTAADPADQVTALYQAHALGLLRLAVIMLGDREAAEDVVQDAFLGLFRRWGALDDPERALAYVRSSVFNGCRSFLRKRARSRRFLPADPDAESAEARVLLGEEHREV